MGSMERGLTNEEIKAAMDQAFAKGMGVELLSLPEIGFVSVREVTPEEMAERRRRDSETHYPCFRPKWMGPPKNWKENE